MTHPALILQSFAVEFPGGGNPIRGIDLQIDAGACHAIIAPNGAGKSTTGLALVGAIPELIPGQVTGSVLVDGHHLDSEWPIQRRSPLIGLTLQDVEAQVLFGTVRDQLDWGQTKSTILRDAVDVLRIGELLDRQCEQLSHGQAQRVLLAAAARDRRLLVFDEAASGLDFRARQDFAQYVELLLKDRRGVLLLGQRSDILAPYSRSLSWLDHGVLCANPPVRAAMPDWSLVTPSACPTGELVVREMTVRRGGFALGPLDIRVPPGDLVALLGDNGSGKTTCLAAIGGLIPFKAGSVTLGGRSMSRRRLTDASLLWPQSPSAATIGASVAEELEAASQTEQLQQLLEQQAPGLAFLEPQRDPLELSFGQARMLNFIVAALGRGLLLADEPEAGLDDASLDFVMQWLHRTRATRSRTVIYATHDLRLAEIADTCVLLRGGKIVETRRSMPARELEVWTSDRPRTQEAR